MVSVFLPFHPLKHASCPARPFCLLCVWGVKNPKIPPWCTCLSTSLFGSIQEEVVKDAESVRSQQQQHLQQHSCTLDECFQLYTKEEQVGKPQLSPREVVLLASVRLPFQSPLTHQAHVRIHPKTWWWTLVHQDLTSVCVEFVLPHQLPYLSGCEGVREWGGVNRQRFLGITCFYVVILGDCIYMEWMHLRVIYTGTSTMI